jgi:hypothetical protein
MGNLNLIGALLLAGFRVGSHESFGGEGRDRMSRGAVRERKIEKLRVSF